MLHCSLAQGAAWNGVAKALPGGLHLTAPDIVGHGAGPEYDPTQDLHDQCYEAILPYLPDGRFDLVGHSYGGTLALRLAIEMPDRVRSLTMVEPVLFAAAKGSGAFNSYLDAAAGFAAAWQGRDKIAATRAFLSSWGNGADFDCLSEAQRRYMADRIYLIVASEPALFDDSAGLIPRLEQVRVPTLLMAGALCQPVVTAILDRMEVEIPKTSRVSIPGAGHMAPITHPGPVAAALQAHLAMT